MKRVLLTGANGFIGRHCLPLLTASDYEVHAVSSKASDNNGDFISWHHVDLLNAKEISALLSVVRPTHLLHLAWCGVPGRYWTEPENLSWVGASLHLLSDFAQHGGQRVVIAGTCAEYDWSSGFCSENSTPLKPKTLYGACKHALQVIVESFAVQTGLSASWGRLFFLYGPYEHPKRLVSSVILSLLKGETALCSHGNQVRDYMYVDDAADAFVKLLDSNLSGPVNIASGEKIKLKEIVHVIANQIKREDLIRLGGIETSTDEPPVIVADVSRLQHELKWRPKCSLVEGIERTIEWWKQHYYEMSASR